MWFIHSLLIESFRRRLIAIACLLCLAPASLSGQTVILQVNVADLGFGFVHLQPIKLETQQGFLAQLTYYGLWAVIVPHAPRSGLGGIVAAPGVCIEHWFRLPEGSDYVGIADGNGDGREDIIAEGATWPYSFRVITLDVVRCR